MILRLVTLLKSLRKELKRRREPHLFFKQTSHQFILRHQRQCLLLGSSNLKLFRERNRARLCPQQRIQTQMLLFIVKSQKIPHKTNSSSNRVTAQMPQKAWVMLLKLQLTHSLIRSPISPRQAMTSTKNTGLQVSHNSRQQIELLQITRTF